jgi:hypothetical protein
VSILWAVAENLSENDSNLLKNDMSPKPPQIGRTMTVLLPSVHVLQLLASIRSVSGSSSDRLKLRLQNSIQAVERLAALIDQEKVVAGGASDPKARYIDPTILYPVTWEDPIMEDEIFGPLLPILHLQGHRCSHS